jgi:uncharacterized cysteine cluster protein YcgN (CxxCxxCC family)
MKKQDGEPWAFWEEVPLERLTPAQWESLCDGCGKCCLNKIEDEDTGEIFFTNVACRLLDLKTCQCSNYKGRKKQVPDCQILTPSKVRRLPWLPATCAYRLVAEKKPLPPWHHLISGSRNTIHSRGMSVRGRIISEKGVKDLAKHVVDWD